MYMYMYLHVCVRIYSQNPLIGALSKEGGINVRLHQPHCRAEDCTLYTPDGGNTLKWRGKEKNREQRPNVCCAVDLFLEAFYAHDYRYSSVIINISIIIIIKSLHYNIFLTQQTYTYVYVCV